MESNTTAPWGPLTDRWDAGCHVKQSTDCRRIWREIAKRTGHGPRGKRPNPITDEEIIRALLGVGGDRRPAAADIVARRTRRASR